MANQVVTDFVINGDSAFKAVDQYKAKLTDLEKPSNLGVSLEKATNQIASGFDKAGKVVEDFKNKVNTSQPTISRYWENEADKVRKSVEDIKRGTEQVTAATARLDGRDAARRANIGKSSPLIDSARTYGESRFNDANVKPFADISEFRKRTDELKNLGSEAEKTAAKINKIRGFGAVFRELNLGINETELNVAITAYEKINERAANAAKSVKSIGTQGKAASGAFAELGSISTAGLATFGLVAIAGAAIVKVTKDIRTEAERRLSVEEKISAAYGKQLSTLYNIGIEVAKTRANAERDRNFNRTLDNSSLDQLKSQRQTTQFLFDRTGDATRKTQYGADLSALDKQIDELNQKAKNAPQLAYEKQAEFTRKTYEDQRNASAKFAKETADFNEKQAKKRADDLKKANNLIDELGKKATDSFTNLYQTANASNPFVAVFSEADTAAKKLNETVSFLPVKLQEAAFAMQSVVDKDKTFSARLGNDLSALDLRQKAGDLRDFKPKAIEDTTKFFNDFVAEGLKQAVAANGGSNVRYNRLANGGFSQSNIADEINKSYDRVSNDKGGFNGFSQRTRTFADLTEREKLDFVNKDNIGLQTKLSAAFDLAGNRKTLNDTQQSEIDRKIISLASGVNPNQLSDRQRELVASSLEKEAVRREAYEANANKLRQEQAGYLKEIRDYQQTLKDKAEKGGSAAVEVTIKDETAAGVETRKQTKTATSSDTENYYKNGGSTYLNDSQRNF